jgi:hypothetical protein
MMEMGREHTKRSEDRSLLVEGKAERRAEIGVLLLHQDRRQTFGKFGCAVRHAALT